MPEASGDGFPEFPATLRRAVVEITQRSMTGACAEQPAPKCVRQIGKPPPTRPEIVPEARRREFPAQAWQAQAIGCCSCGFEDSLSHYRKSGVTVTQGVLLPGERFREMRVNRVRWSNGPPSRPCRTHACLEISFREQLFVSQYSSVSRHL